VGADPLVPASAHPLRLLCAGPAPAHMSVSSPVARLTSILGMLFCQGASGLPAGRVGASPLSGASGGNLGRRNDAESCIGDTSASAAPVWPDCMLGAAWNVPRGSAPAGSSTRARRCVCERASRWVGTHFDRGRTNTRVRTLAPCGGSKAKHA